MARLDACGHLECLVEVARTKIQAGQLAFDLDRLAPAKVTAAPEIVGTRSGGHAACH